MGVNVFCGGLRGVDRVPGLRGDNVEKDRKRYTQKKNEEE